MKALFMTILKMLDECENVTEALMFESNDYSRIKFESEDGTFTISISKEKTDGNSGN